MNNVNRWSRRQRRRAYAALDTDRVVGTGEGGLTELSTTELKELSAL